MTVVKVPLIEVLTIKSKMLKQIRVLSAYGTADAMALVLKIRELMKTNHLRPIGWINGDFLEAAPTGQEMWLVNLDEQLYFVAAPEKNSVFWKQHQPLPQLFA